MLHFKVDDILDLLNRECVKDLLYIMRFIGTMSAISLTFFLHSFLLIFSRNCPDLQLQFAAPY